MRVAAVALLVVRHACACSFIVANYRIEADELAHANEFNRRRGPDGTNVHHILANGADWTFVHNLLSMTGAVTLQPFVGANGSIVALFNGEIYNYGSLAHQLTGNASEFPSDGYVLIPAYQRWGWEFVRRLEGEFAIVLLDVAAQRLLLSTDAFSTKPLWHACWREHGQERIVVATYESVLKRLGAPDATRVMASPNEIALLDLRKATDAPGGAPATCSFEQRTPFYTWDLRQYKTHTRDWTATFRDAVLVRTDRLKHRVFMGLSAGYDSGAIALALKQLDRPFLAYSVRADESVSVVLQRSRACESVAEVVFMNMTRADYRAQARWLDAHCEEFRYLRMGRAWWYPHVQDRRGQPFLFRDARRYQVKTDGGGTGLSAILALSRPVRGLIYLSGAGADEIISDYAIHGRKINPHSCFNGVFPRELNTSVSSSQNHRQPFFPWCGFYYGAQRNYLMKDELIAGAHGVEGRYPFLDPRVVQEYLWLSHEVKNAEYKKPIADFLREAAFPNLWDTKVGFNTVKGLGKGWHK